MKKVQLLLIVLSICFLLGCDNVVLDRLKLSAINEANAKSALNMPDEMKEFSENPDVEWMAGMLAVLKDSEILHKISAESFELFSDPGDIFRVTITAQNGLKKTQRFELMVFADGVPVAFTVDGEEYRSYPIELGPEQKQVELQFVKKFELNLGRLDFVLSYAENPQENYHLMSYTMWINRTGEAQIPEHLCTTLEQRVGIQGKYSGDVIDAWIWNEGINPVDTDQMGPRTISIHSKETILLEAVAAKPGLYRTVLVVGETPVNFEWNGTQYSYIDWESTGTNMIQLPIKLFNIPPSGSIYTITTPLDADALAQSITASHRIELTADGEE